MNNEVEIEVLRPFNKTAQGNLADVGERFRVDATRAEELERNGLAKRTKAAPKPANKMAPEPANKGVQAAEKVEQATARTITSSRK